MARTVKTLFEFTTRAERRGAQQIRDDLEDLARAEDEVADEAQNVAEHSDDAERGIGNLGKAANLAVKGIAAAGAAVLALGAAVVGLAVSDFTSAEDAMARFQAQTGVSNDELAEYQEIATDLYNLGLGESIEDITGAMAQVRAATGLEGDALEKTTQRALVFAQAFDRDVTESLRAAQTMANVMGNDAAENFDLIAGAMQVTGDPAGDLLDTLNEYSSTFEELGFSGLEFIALLDSGLEAGAYNTDVIADGFREFGIRLKDGTSEASVLALGLEDMYAGFQRGEATGAEMFGAILTGLQEIEDPILRNQMGVEIFGTKWEDLGESVFLGLDPAIAETYEFGDAISSADQALSRTVSATWTRFTRTLRSTLTTALGPLIQRGLEVMIPLLDKVGVWMANVGIPKFVEFGKAAAGMLGDAIDFVGELIDKLGGAPAIMTALSTAFTGVKTLIGDALTGVKDLYTELKSAFDQGGLPNLLAVVWDKIKGGVIDAWTWVNEKIITPIANELNLSDWESVTNNLSGLLEKFLGTAWSTLVSIGDWILTNVITPIVDYLKGVDWADVGSKLVDLLGKYLTLVGTIYATIGAFIYEKVIQPIVDYLKTVDWADVGTRLADLLEQFLGLAASGLTSIGVWLWDNVISKIVSYLQNVNWSNTISRLADMLEQFLGVAASVLTSIGTWLWDNVVSPIINYLKTVDWADVGSKLLDLLEKLLGFVGAGLTSIGSWVWDNIIDPIVQKLLDPQTYQDMYDAAVEVGKAIFNAIKDAIAGIPQAIVDKVNEGIQKALDALGIGGGGEDWSGSGQPPAPGGGGGMSDAWSHMDTGGRGVPGVGYLIGRDAMPELFVPDQAGTFYPRGQYNLMPAMAQAGGGTVHSWAGATLNLYGVTDVQALYRALENLKRRKNL